MTRTSIPQKEVKALCALSGGVCAFPGCGRSLVEPGTEDDDATFLGEIAHIVADSRQGPRGNSPDRGRPKPASGGRVKTGHFEEECVRLLGSSFSAEGGAQWRTNSKWRRSTQF